MAATREVPFARYYGSVDATPLFVVLAAAYWRRTADLAFIRSHLAAPHRGAAVDRPLRRPRRRRLRRVRAPERRRADPAGLEGFARFGVPRRRPHGGAADRAVRGAGLRVCGQARRRPSSREVLGEPALASALARRGRGAAAAVPAALLVRGARPVRARARRRQAALRGGVVQRGPCAVDRHRRARACRAHGAAAARARPVLGLGRAHAGHGPGALQPDVVPQRLDLAARQRAACAKDWRVMATPMRRCELLGAAFDGSLHFEGSRLPELFCGFPRRAGEGPTRYPVACSPQAWAATAVFGMLAGCLGLEFEAAQRCVRMRSPRLPPFVDWLRIEGLARRRRARRPAAAALPRQRRRRRDAARRRHRGRGGGVAAARQPRCRSAGSPHYSSGLAASRRGRSVVDTAGAERDAHALYEAHARRALSAGAAAVGHHGAGRVRRAARLRGAAAPRRRCGGGLQDRPHVGAHAGDVRHRRAGVRRGAGAARAPQRRAAEAQRPRPARVGVRDRGAHRPRHRPDTAASTPYTADTVRAHVDGVCAALEVVDDRHADYGALDVRGLVADNAWNAGVVLSDFVAAWPDLPRSKASSASTASRSIAASAAMCWAIRWWSWPGWPTISAARGERLRAGQFVMTGSLVPTRVPGRQCQLPLRRRGIGSVSATVAD